MQNVKLAPISAPPAPARESCRGEVLAGKAQGGVDPPECARVWSNARNREGHMAISLFWTILRIFVVLKLNSSDDEKTGNGWRRWNLAKCLEYDMENGCLDSCRRDDYRNIIRMTQTRGVLFNLHRVHLQQQLNHFLTGKSA